MKVQRKYRMMRLGTGDYLMYGNDGVTVFRVRKYFEDGSLERWDGEQVTGNFWGVWAWPEHGPKVFSELAPDPSEEWDRWYLLEDLFKTRQEAIDAALLWEWKRDNPVQGPKRKPVDIATAIASLAEKSSSNG